MLRCLWLIKNRETKIPNGKATFLYISVHCLPCGYNSYHDTDKGQYEKQLIHLEHTQSLILICTYLQYCLGNVLPLYIHCI